MKIVMQLVCTAQNTVGFANQVASRLSALGLRIKMRSHNQYPAHGIERVWQTQLLLLQTLRDNALSRTTIVLALITYGTNHSGYALPLVPREFRRVDVNQQEFHSPANVMCNSPTTNN